MWKAEDMSEQRVKFAIRASSGKEEMKALCQEFEISRPTGYLWLKRYRECERIGELAELSRRPHRSPNQTVAEQEQRVLALRQQYPDWGAKTDRVAEAGAVGATAHHGTPHPAAERLGAGSGPASGGDETLPAGSTESTVADGFQRDAGQADGLSAAGGDR